ncbi:MAG: hypothetical protein RAP70_03400 [Candidatus Celaenobacter antarcticus]|nr:hypothetical protein [Candidatus Celaenobacter antarcticus]
MKVKRASGNAQTLGIIGFIILLPAVLSWILFILHLSHITNLFKIIFEAIPTLMMIIFTLNPLGAIALGVFSNSYESRNIYARIASAGGVILIGFLLIAIIIR